MSMVPFKYCDFWDVPRFIVCTVAGSVVLLVAGFDDSLDEYRSDYSVYTLPPGLEWGSVGSWLQLPESQGNHIGSIPVNEIEFDPTLRKQIEVGPLLKLLKH